MGTATENIKDLYEIVNPDDNSPIKIRLINCAWHGIIYSYKSIEPDYAGKDKTVKCKFEFEILDESEDFDIEDFATETQMAEFETLLGRVLQDVFADLEK